jgi:hypothetical protein
MEKKCTKCKEVKSLDEFCKDKSKKSGKSSRCKTCYKLYYEKNIKKDNEEYTLEIPNEKICNKCKVVKILDSFYNNKKGKYGKNPTCKLCNTAHQKVYIKEYYKNNKQKIKQRSKQYYINNPEANKNYAKNNKERLKKKRENNKEAIKKYQKNWRSKNQGYTTEYVKLRRKIDSLFKLRINISGNVSKALKTQGYNKKTKTYKILQCEYDFFIYFINNIANNGYTYGIGNLHLDHVVPVSLGQTEDEVILLCHYSNYQLLSAHENVTKGNRSVKPLNLARVLEHHPQPDMIREIHKRL